MDMTLYSLLNKKIKGLASGVKSHQVNGLDLILTFNDETSSIISFSQPKDGISIDRLEFDETTNELLYYLTDGTSGSAGTIPVGKDGLSAYEIAKKNGFIGTEQEWFDSLKGADGVSPIINIGGNGNWFIDGVDTGVLAKGPQGISPTIDPMSKHWMIGTTDTGVVAEGVNGVQGADGITYTPKIGTVTNATTASASVTVDVTTQEATFDFGIPQGAPGEDAYQVALNNGFDGTEQEWLDSLTGKDGAAGKDGITYTPKIGTVTTGETVAVTLDLDTVNATQTFNFTFPNGTGDNNTTEVPDGVTYVNISESEDIGEVSETIDADRLGGRLPSYYINTDNYKDYLDINVEADFLTEEGHGKLRFLNGVFQYYNEDTSEWTDAAITPENVYIMNMTPQTMQSISATYDIKLGKIKLKWDEAPDTVIDGQAACLVEKVIIRRKLGEAPENETDGELVTEVKRNQFGLYKNAYYIDDTFTPNIGEEWYYKAFPMSTTGFYNYSSVNETSVLCKDYYVYGFRIDQTESDPASMITYIADNVGYSPAHMNYTTDEFDYGSWQDAWFMDVKPCMLKYDGTVAYYLNPNDYTKKLDGTDSDVANLDFAGNAMIEFPKVYYKCVNISDDVAEYRFCSQKLDEDYHCWSHIDNNGNEIDYCYMPCYNGANVNSVLRSISGQTPMHSQTASTEITYATANNKTDDIIWYTEVFSDRQLVNLLLLLIGKSTDSQTVFGNGHYTGNTSASGVLKTGTLNTQGLFYGTNSTGKAVKVFGIENWWGNQHRRIAGYINNKGNQMVKLTYGQSDMSTVNGYNMTGDNYINIGCTPSGATESYISKMTFKGYGLIATATGGSATTYYTDIFWFNNSQVDYAVVGGDSYGKFFAGALCCNLGNLVSSSAWSTNASISCKPLATATN